MKEGKRDLLEKLKHLTWELIDINKDIATLDVRDSLTAARRAKKAMLAHQRNTEAFKKELDEIRKKILMQKAGLTQEERDKENEQDIAEEQAEAPPKDSSGWPPEDFSTEVI